MLTPEGDLPIVVVDGCAGYAPRGRHPHCDAAFWDRELALEKRRVDEASTLPGISR